MVNTTVHSVAKAVKVQIDPILVHLILKFTIFTKSNFYFHYLKVSLSGLSEKI